MLALHPQHQEKVFEEILRIMPTKDVDLTQSDLDKLVFTELCIRETLRLFPTAPVIARVATKPIQLTNCIVPPNIPMIFGLRQIHLQPKYYGSTAHIFDPDRFLNENFQNLPNAAYIPFSFGPRNCIGAFETQKLSPISIE